MTRSESDPFRENPPARGGMLHKADNPRTAFIVSAKKALDDTTAEQRCPTFGCKAEVNCPASVHLIEGDRR